MIDDEALPRMRYTDIDTALAALLLVWSGL